MADTKHTITKIGEGKKALPTSVELDVPSDSKNISGEHKLKEKFKVVTLTGEYEFFGDFSFDKDANDCMGTGTLKMPYNEHLWAYWEPGFTTLKVYGGTHDYGKIFEGRTREIAQDGEFITINMQDCGWRLKQTCPTTFEDEEVAEVFKRLVKEAGMTPVIMGLSKSYAIPDKEGSYSAGGEGSAMEISKTGSESYTTKVTKAPVLSRSDPIGSMARAKAAASASGMAFSANGAVTGAGKPSCAYNCGSYSKWYTTSVANHCPECGKSGLIVWVQGKDYHWCAREDNPGYEGMYVCCQRLGGCDSDWCICGNNHSRSAKYGGFKDLQVLSGMSVTTGPITLSRGTFSAVTPMGTGAAVGATTGASKSGASAKTTTSTITKAVKAITPVISFGTQAVNKLFSLIMVLILPIGFLGGTLAPTIIQSAKAISSSTKTSASSSTTKNGGTLGYTTLGTGAIITKNLISGNTTSATPGSPGGYVEQEYSDDVVNVGAEGEQGSGEKLGTYEDEINGICAQADEENLIWFTTQNNECVLVDFKILMEEISKKAFTIENWMMEYPSFNLNVNQFGFANTVKVKYNNGTITRSYDDLVWAFGEMAKEFTKTKMNKQEAENFANLELARAVRDFGLELKSTVLYSYRITPGSFVKMQNPQSGHTEIYYVSGVNVSNSPTSALTASLSLRYAPDNPLVGVIPEIAGTPESLDAIGNKAATFTYSGACQTAACMESKGTGDCFGMSDWIYEAMVRAGYRARIITYYSPYSSSGTHRTVQYMQGDKWVDFPYDQFGIDKMFKAMPQYYGTNFGVIKGG